MVAGNLVDHISKRFGSGDLWPKINKLEREVTDALNALDIQTVSDYFNIPMSQLPTEERYIQLMERMKLLGFDEAFESNVGEFVVRKAAEGTQTGYGSFGLGRQHFIGQSADDIAARLSYIMPTFQIDALDGGSRVLSGSVISEQFLRDTARHMTDPSSLMTGTRMVFDVESAGLDPSQKVWQVSARLMKGDTELENVNLRFKNTNMDRGLYMSKRGQNMTFQQFYESVAGNVEWLDFDSGIEQFLNMSKRADVFVGQNAAFDVRMLSFGLKGEKGSRYYTDEAFRLLADDFLERATTGGRLVDTRLFSAALFSDSINIADELKLIDKFTPYSMENILLETSFLEDLSKRVGWDEINARLKAGLHYGDIDTWFEDHLFRMQTEVFSGKGDGLLRVQSVADKAIRAQISAASAITPFTKVAELGGLTPIQHLARTTRTLDAPMFDGKLLQQAMEGQLFEAGIFSNWTKGLLREDGKIKWGQTLTDPLYAFIDGLPGHTAGAPTIQARAIDAGLPFGGISSFERLISTLIGQTTGNTPIEGISEARALMGELSGSGLVRTAEKANVYGGRNVALPVDVLLKWESYASEVGGIDVSSNLHRALSAEGPEAVQWGRWSAFSWKDKRGRIQHDVALVADLFGTGKDFDKVQMNSLLTFLRENQANLSITEEVMQSIELAASQGRIEKYGIQLGTMRGKDSDSVRLLAKFMEEHGFGVDRGAADLVTPIFGPSGRLRAAQKQVADWFFTGATLVSGADGALPEGGDVLANVKGSASLNDLIMQSADDQAVKAGVRWAKSRNDAAAGRNIHLFLEKNLPKMRRHVGIAAGALAGYYYFKRKKDQSQYDETMGVIGYENADFYEGYKQEMGEIALPDYRRRHMDALATAGTVGTLDRAKIGHHAMGPNKHAHLYGGGR